LELSTQITDVPESQGVLGWDRFAYVNNNPVNFNDPSGHNADCATTDSECQNQIKKEKELQSKEKELITDFIMQLPGSSEDWNNIAKIFDVLSLATDLYAVGAVVYAGIAGAGLPAPLIALGLPEIPVATGLAGMGIAELAVQPVIAGGNFIATGGLISTLIADTKAGTTNIDKMQFSRTSLNSITLTDLGWMSPEAFISFGIQSITVANDFNLLSFPMPQIPTNPLFPSYKFFP
jgi:hypothetical protein